MKKLRSLISILVCLAMVLAMVPPVFAAEGDVFVKVTDVADLAVGDQIIIVSDEADYALSTNQKNNNREATAITKNGDAVTVTESVQILTLEAGAVDGTFAFNTGAGYLYAASSSKNYLRTEEALSANSSWNITIADGATSVVAAGENTRATMQYNPNSGAPLFACYTDATQGAISLYKLTENTEEEPNEPENPLVLGHNELYSVDGVSGEYAYIAQQAGTLYFTVRYYCFYDTNYGEGILTMPSWSQLLINGEAITSFRQTLEVAEGDVITVVLTSDEGEYTVGLNLSYEGYYEEPLGSELNPIELSVTDCPTETVVIPAGGTVWYKLNEDFFFDDYCLTVAGEDAYIYCDNDYALAFNVMDFYYYAENGLVTFWVYEDMIQIGNTGDSDAVFTLDAYAFNDSLDMTEGDNGFWLPRNSNGMYLWWTAQAAGEVTLKITGENWLYYAGVVEDYYEEIPGEASWYVEGDSDTVTLSVEAGDVIGVYITTLNADICNPGGTLNVNLNFEPAAPDYVLGDANGDGAINTTDAKIVMQYELGLVSGEDFVLAALDVNGDGAINTTDAKLIMQYELGIIPGFGGDTDPEQPEDTDGMQLTIAEAIERCNKAGDTPTTIKYTITGKVTEVVNTTYGNFYIEDATGSLYIYGCYSADGDKRYDTMDNFPQVGDTVTLYGVLMSYMGETPQMKNAWCLSGGTGERTPVEEEPSENEYVTAPEVGVAYKLGMYQGNLGETYYFAGTTANTDYYMSTTTDKAAAVDVYLEEAEGGYRMYFYVDGTKTYLDVYKNGNYVNLRLTTEPTAVFTWDAAYNTLVTDIEGTDYYVGTYNTYSTLSASKYSYISTSFPSHLFP